MRLTLFQKASLTRILNVLLTSSAVKQASNIYASPLLRARALSLHAYGAVCVLPVSTFEACAGGSVKPLVQRTNRADGRAVAVYALNPAEPGARVTAVDYECSLGIVHSFYYSSNLIICQPCRVSRDRDEHMKGAR